jgi:hypothetical protein
MGTYYRLVNDTKKKEYHLGGYVKAGPITLNKAVHMAFVNLMFDNRGDSFRILDDCAWGEENVYEEVDLLESKDLSPRIHAIIVKTLAKQEKQQMFREKLRRIFAMFRFWE